MAAGVNGFDYFKVSKFYAEIVAASIEGFPASRLNPLNN